MRWIGRMFPALVLFAGAAIFWAKVAQRTADTPGVADRKPTIVGLPPVHVQPGSPATSSPSDESSIRARYEQILHGVDSLSDGDQKRLDSLSAQMKRAVRDHEAQFVEFFRDQFPQLERMPLKRSFFLAGAMLDYVPANAEPLKELLDLDRRPGPRGDEASGPSHLNLVKSFVLRRLAERPAPREKYRELLPVLVDLAKKEPDLAVAREALVVLTRLGLSSDPESIKQDVLRARRTEERRAFENI